MAEGDDSCESFGIMNTSDSREQEPDQTQDADTQSGSNTRPTCPSCGKTGIRKRYMQCAVCSRHWHMTCVRLSSAQANALHRVVPGMREEQSRSGTGHRHINWSYVSSIITATSRVRRGRHCRGPGPHPGRLEALPPGYPPDP